MVLGLSDKKRFSLAILFLIALSLRLIPAFLPTELYSDDLEYHNLARGIVNGQGFNSDTRHPAYPFFLAFIYFFTNSSILAVKITQAFLGALTCILVYWLSKNIFGKTSLALIPAIAVTIYPHFILYTGRLFLETLHIFLIVACFVFIFKNFDNPKIKYSIFTGVLFGISVLTKSVILPFLVILSGWMIIFTKIPLRSKTKHVVIMVSVVILTLVPWVIRNYIVYKQFVLTTTIGGAHLWGANNPDIVSIGVRDPQKLASAGEEKEKELTRLSAIEKDRYFYKITYDYILKHPKEVIRLLPIKMKRLWHLWPDNPKEIKVYSLSQSYPDLLFFKNKFFTKNWLIKSAKILFHLWYNIFFIGMLFSVFFILLNKQSKAKALLLFLFIWCISFIMIFVCVPGDRYRLILDPYVFILGWYGIYNGMLYLINRLRSGTLRA